MADPARADRVLVIIPTYNEIENIEHIVSRLRANVPDADVLITDDNSPDGTGRVADDLSAADPHVHVLHRTSKDGLSAAYLASFRWGLQRDYDIFVEFDADGSHQPEELPRLLAALDSADMVKGSRWVPGGSVVNWPKSREWLSRAGSFYTRMLLGIPVKDITGGLNLFRRETLEAIVDHVDAAGYGIQRDLTWHAHRQGFTITELPIEFVERVRGRSKLGKDVFMEALAKTTSMGLHHRADQAKALLRRATPGAKRRAEDAGALARAVGRTGVHAVDHVVRGRRNAG